MRILAFGILLMLAHTISAIEAAQTSYTNSVWDYVWHGAGFAFRTQTNILITALGYDFATNSYDSVTVQVLTTNGAVIVSALVSTNSPRIGKTFYEPVTSVLIPNGTKTIMIGVDLGCCPPSIPSLWLGRGLRTNQFALGDFGQRSLLQVRWPLLCIRLCIRQHEKCD